MRTYPLDQPHLLPGAAGLGKPAASPVLSDTFFEADFVKGSDDSTAAHHVWDTEYVARCGLHPVPHPAIYDAFQEAARLKDADREAHSGQIHLQHTGGCCQHTAAEATTESSAFAPWSISQLSVHCTRTSVRLLTHCSTPPHLPTGKHTDTTLTRVHQCGVMKSCSLCPSAGKRSEASGGPQ